MSNPADKSAGTPPESGRTLVEVYKHRVHQFLESGALAKAEFEFRQLLQSLIRSRGNDVAADDPIELELSRLHQAIRAAKSAVETASNSGTAPDDPVG